MHACVYACMYVSMYACVCMHVCMCVCLHECVYVCMSWIATGTMHSQRQDSLKEYAYYCLMNMRVCMCVFIHVCMSLSRFGERQTEENGTQHLMGVVKICIINNEYQLQGSTAS